MAVERDQLQAQVPCMEAHEEEAALAAGDELAAALDRLLRHGNGTMMSQPVSCA